MFSINEDEFNQMQGRFEVIDFCLTMIDKGYPYNTYVFCDIYGDDGFNSIENEAEKIESILGTSVGYGSLEVVSLEEVSKYGIKSSEEEDADYGEPYYLLEIDNELTSKFVKYSLNTDIFVSNLHDSFNEATQCSDTNLLKVIFDDTLKVITGPYIDLFSFLDSYYHLFNTMEAEIKKYESMEVS